MPNCVQNRFAGRSPAFGVAKRCSLSGYLQAGPRSTTHLSGQQNTLLALRNLDFRLDCVHTRSTRLCLLSPNPAHSAARKECGSKKAFRGRSLHRRKPHLWETEGGLNDWRPPFTASPDPAGLGWQTDVSDSRRFGTRLQLKCSPQCHGSCNRSSLWASPATITVD